MTEGPFRLGMFRELLERTIYWESEPPPRKRDADKPMQVICPGFPRSATESLQVALITLGYDYTYHVRVLRYLFLWSSR